MLHSPAILAGPAVSLDVPHVPILKGMIILDARAPVIGLTALAQ
jgi:hypothetical protein